MQDSEKADAKGEKRHHFFVHLPVMTKQMTSQLFNVRYLFSDVCVCVCVCVCAKVWHTKLGAELSGNMKTLKLATRPYFSETFLDTSDF